MKALLALVLSFATLCSFAAEPAKPNVKRQDPIVGKWRWSIHNYLINFVEDGTMSGPQEMGTGVWKALPTTTVERKYQLTWKGGEGVDIMILSPDGKKMSGKTLAGDKFSAVRVE